MLVIHFLLISNILTIILAIPISTLHNYLDIARPIISRWGNRYIKFGNLLSRVKQGLWVVDRFITLVVDCKEQGCVRSTYPDIENSTHSGKYKQSTLILLIGCDPIKGRVIFLSKSYLGAKNDQSCFNEENWKEMTGNSGEYILADKGFSGEYVVTKHRNYKHRPLTPIQNAENNEIDKYRIIIENVIGWCSKYAICNDQWRIKSMTSKSGVERMTTMHHEYWTIVAGILNKYSTVRK